MNGQRDLMGLVSVVVVATALFGSSSPPTTVDEVIERHTKAMGGRAAIEAIQSIEIDLHIADPKFEVDGTYFAARPGKMRIDVNAGGERVFTEAFDGQKGVAMGKQRRSAEGGDRESDRSAAARN